MGNNKTLLYGGIYSGDWVACSNCGETMLLPFGADKCPQCGKIGCLSWVSECENEHEVNCDYLVKIGVDTESTFRDLQQSEFLNESN